MTTFNDDFNRADASTLGSNWVTMSGKLDIRIVTNQAAGPSGTSTDGVAYLAGSAGTFGADQSAEATVSGMSGGANYCGVGVRMGASTGYVFITDGVSGITDTEIGKYVGGVYSALTGVTTTVADGDVIKISVSGTSTAVLTAYKNGVVVGTYSDSSSPHTSGQPGLDSYGSAARFDNFSATDGAGTSFVPRSLLLGVG